MVSGVRDVEETELTRKGLCGTRSFRNRFSVRRRDGVLALPSPPIEVGVPRRPEPTYCEQPVERRHGHTQRPTDAHDRESFRAAGVEPGVGEVVGRDRPIWSARAAWGTVISFGMSVVATGPPAAAD